VLPWKQRALRRVEIGDGDGYHADSIEDYFHVQYFEAIDYGSFLLTDDIVRYFNGQILEYNCFSLGTYTKQSNEDKCLFKFLLL